MRRSRGLACVLLKKSSERMYKQGGKLVENRVRELMTADPFTLSPEADLAEAYDMMDGKRIRHIPVVNPVGQLLGLVSHRDLVKSALDDVRSVLPLSEQRRLLRNFQVRDIMVRQPETIAPDDDARTAGETMYENKYGCLPVVDGDTLVGILTEADYVRHFVSSN
jgi:CBS domain-containing protein